MELEPGLNNTNVKKIAVKCTVNGEAKKFECYPMERLLDVIREKAELTGTKEGCGEGECGACSVFVNGELVNSCLIPMLQMEGAQIQTIEGLTVGSELHQVQKAFWECGGAQCGICTPGMIMASVNLLQKYPNPSEGEIRQGLSGNLCRCTGYMKIFDAVKKASKG